MGRVWSVISGKGGVGKTTVAVNTATLLSLSGASTLIIDADIYNPCVNFHLGLSPNDIGLQELLEGTAAVEDVLTIHPISGLRCISSAINFKKRVRIDNFSKVARSLDYEHVIIDCAPGLSPVVEQAMEAADEYIKVIAPSIPCATDTMKILAITEGLEKGRKAKFVLNRMTGMPYDLHPREITGITQMPLDAMIPEDTAVPKSIAKKTPVVMDSPYSKPSTSIRKFVRQSFGVKNPPATAFATKENEGAVHKIANALDYLWK